MELVLALPCPGVPVFSILWFKLCWLWRGRGPLWLSFYFFFEKRANYYSYIYLWFPPAPCPLSPIGNLTMMVSMLMVTMLLANAVEGQHSLGYGGSWGSAQGRWPAVGGLLLAHLALGDLLGGRTGLVLGQIKVSNDLQNDQQVARDPGCNPQKTFPLRSWASMCQLFRE